MSIEPIKTAVWFKYNPTKEKMVIECQPIKPYSMIDQLNVDKFCKEEPSPNPGFKKKAPGQTIVINIPGGKKGITDEQK